MVIPRCYEFLGQATAPKTVLEETKRATRNGRRRLGPKRLAILGWSTWTWFRHASTGTSAAARITSLHKAALCLVYNCQICELARREAEEGSTFGGDTGMSSKQCRVSSASAEAISPWDGHASEHASTHSMSSLRCVDVKLQSPSSQSEGCPFSGSGLQGPPWAP